MLFDSTEIAPWEHVIAQYPDALQHHVANKKDDSLLSLDHWYQTTLPSLLCTRKPKYMDAKELQQLMSWKLKRGKFRPLIKLVASNADPDVKRVSQEAFKLVSSDLRASITKMSELKGVGAATASAILCAGVPEKVPFMADETMDSVPGLGAIAYTIPYYIKFATKVIEKAAQLKANGSTTVNSPHLVEKALWTDYMINKYNITGSTLKQSDTDHKTNKRKKDSEKEPVQKTTHSDQSKKRKEPVQKTTHSDQSKKRKEPEKEPAQSGKKAKTTARATPRTTPRATRSTTRNRP